MELYSVAAQAGAAVPGTEDAALVAVAADGRRFAYSRDRRTISVRARRVPTDPAALRAWVGAHRTDRRLAR